MKKLACGIMCFATMFASATVTTNLDSYVEYIQSSGTQWIDTGVIGKSTVNIAADPPPSLTPRQHEILSAMARGLTNREVARQLGISEDRVKDHVITILQKIGAANRTEAVAIALQKHLVKI